MISFEIDEMIFDMMTQIHIIHVHKSNKKL